MQKVPAESSRGCVCGESRELFAGRTRFSIDFHNRGDYGTSSLRTFSCDFKPENCLCYTIIFRMFPVEGVEYPRTSDRFAQGVDFTRSVGSILRHRNGGAGLTRLEILLRVALPRPPKYPSVVTLTSRSLYRPGKLHRCESHPRGRRTFSNTTPSRLCTSAHSRSRTCTMQRDATQRSVREDYRRRITGR